ncbi:MAG: ATP-binding protein, partial [bacterium]
FLREAYETDQLLAQAKSITLKLDLQPNLPKVQMDPNRIGQVVNNLITNAIKFSFPESEITLRARTAEGEQVEISVEDQGQGIPEDEIPKMFREFGRLSVRPTAGESSTGLGLAIVKRMVEAHGGRIWVQSQHGVGSVFTFALPIRNSQPQEQGEHHDS